MTDEEARVIAERICADAKERKREKQRAADSKRRRSTDAAILRSREVARAYYWKNPELHRAKSLARVTRAKYGITVEEKAALLAQQGGCCAICKRTESGSKMGWHTDHCHQTGVVRGILCQPCNYTLGHAKDSRATLLAAVAYLDKFASEQVPMLEAA